MTNVTKANPTYNTQSAVLENADLLRVIGDYIFGIQLPFILSSKIVKDALKPLNTNSGDCWIISKKECFVTSVSMVEWAESLGCGFSLNNDFNNLFIYAASNGSVDVLKWAHKKYPPSQYPAGVRHDVCAAAAENGHLQVLEYLKTLDTTVEWSEEVCYSAAAGGQLHALQWLREVLDPPCPWDAGTCINAALAGELVILQWLRTQDPPCPWNAWTCYYAAFNGDLSMLKWLRSQDPPCPWRKQECIRTASDNKHHGVVEWIIRSYFDLVNE